MMLIGGAENIFGILFILQMKDKEDLTGLLLSNDHRRHGRDW